MTWIPISMYDLPLPARFTTYMIEVSANVLKEHARENR